MTTRASTWSFPSPAFSAPFRCDLKVTNWKLRDVSVSNVAVRKVNVGSAAVARTIPGLRNARMTLPRKPVRSERLNDISDESGVSCPRHPSRPALTQVVAELVLPLAPNAQHRGRVLLNSAIAYSLVFLSLAIVHIPFVIRLGARSLVHAFGIFCGDLVANHLGQLLLYGTVIALLSHAEGLFDDDSRSSTWGECLVVAVK